MMIAKIELSSFELVPDWRESRGLAALSSAAQVARSFKLAEPSDLTVRVESEPIPDTDNYLVGLIRTAGDATIGR
jgi:hypothetical protein